MEILFYYSRESPKSLQIFNFICQNGLSKKINCINYDELATLARIGRMPAKHANVRYIPSLILKSNKYTDVYTTKIENNKKRLSIIQLISNIFDIKIGPQKNTQSVRVPLNNRLLRPHKSVANNVLDGLGGILKYNDDGIIIPISVKNKF